MEYVGRRVRKTVEGRGTILGFVRGYDQATGFCEIVYDGGAFEEVHFSGVASLLVPPLRLEESCGGNGNERRRVGNEGIDDGSSIIGSGVFGNSNINMNAGFDLNMAASNSLNDDDDDDRGGIAIVGEAMLRGLDLNEAPILELGEELCLNEGTGEERLVRDREMIDLNLDPNEGYENFDGGREVRCFDLNLRCMEAEECNLIECEGKFERVCDEADMKVTTELPKVDLEADRLRLGLECREGASQEPSFDNQVSKVVGRGRGGRKSKELLGNDVSLPPPGTGLKRRSCRTKRAVVSSPEQVLEAPQLDGISYRSPSPAISGVSYGQTVAAYGKLVSNAVLPPKVELPPSSCNMDLNGVSPFDFLSIYAFLRSFNILIFLSPFELHDFAISVKSDDSTLLFDSIHVSLLRTLRKHLESLSAEGSMSASACLRSINWDSLDLITWPLFLVEYLLLHSPSNIPGLDVCQLKLFQNDYYKLPVSTKLVILQHLCDDITEMETFRSEINRRMLETEQSRDLARSVKHKSSTKRKAALDVANMSCITKGDAIEPADGNNDECSLCRMDGELICCDGCPASFHSRCVGVVTTLLPMGKWYCPECTMEKGKPGMKMRTSVRGAELLGIDPYGRAYYNSCGYLLVLESHGDKYSSFFYKKSDLTTLIEALESSPVIYEAIINDICEQWDIVRGVYGARNDLDDCSYSIQSAFPENRQLDLHPAAVSEILNSNEVFTGEKAHEKLMGPPISSFSELENAGEGTARLDIENHGLRLENLMASSEGSAEVSQTSTKTDTLNGNGMAYSEKCPEIPDQFHSPGKFVIAEDHFTTSTCVNAEKENISLPSYSCEPQTINSGQVLSQVHYEANYVNCYELAKTASSYEELANKLPDKASGDSEKSVKEIIARQLKVVSNRFSEFSWSNIQTLNMDTRREKCGWCFHCRIPDDERKCLFIMNDIFPAVTNYTCDALGIRSRKNSKNHMVDIKCHIICIENHLHGLLLGPWLNPHYSMLWRENVIGANDIGSLSSLLVKLESNLHHLALSAEWRKHVDSGLRMGSSYHFFKNSSRVSSIHGTGRKRANPSKVESSLSSKAATGMRLFWWRGGRVSRMLFNWKVLPHSLVTKAARQGGRKKMPDILYPESGEYAKRTKCISWRAAVEMSRSVEQLALQVRVLDANIRWDDIGNNNLLSKLGMDAKQSFQSFKNVIIRKKCSEGDVVKYLLDFGKRRFIPNVVVRHGSMLEDKSTIRKKYWLEECHVPLHLLKAFEEKRVTCKSNRENPGKLGESSGVAIKPLKNKGFSYLFLRAERFENCLCGHCNKDVLIRDAVSCQHCQGFFHKKHILESAESINAEGSYTCYKCLDGKSVEIDARKKNSKFPNVKNASKGLKLLHTRKMKKMRKKQQSLTSKSTKTDSQVVPLRHSARNAERITKLALQNAKVKKRKRCEKSKPEKGKFKKPKNSIWKKKRTPVNSSFWLNGIRLSRRPNDERLMHFRSRMLLVLSGTEIFISNKPKCSLCKELEYKSDLNYLSCESCGVWFHGDALDLTADKIEHIIGFKCHMCLNKKPPICPHHCLI